MTYPTNTLASVVRLIKDTQHKSQYGNEPIYIDVPVLLVPAGPEIQMVYPNVSAFALFDAFVYETSYVLENSDKLIAEGAEYIIKGVPQYYQAAGVSYIRLVCEKVL